MIDLGLNYANILSNFNNILTQKYGDKVDIVNVLCTVWSLDRAGVKRKLRGDVKISLEEFGNACLQLDLTIDLLKSTKHDSHTLVYINQDPITLFTDAFLLQIEQVFNFYNTYGDLRVCRSSAIMPSSLFLGYESLTRYFILRWLHHSSREEIKDPSFHNLTFEASLVRNRERCWSNYTSFPHTTFVLYDGMIKALTREILEYRGMGLVTNDAVLLIKEDLKKYLIDLESIAEKGCWNTSGNEVSLYLCPVPPTDIQLFESTVVKKGIVSALGFSTAASTDDDVFSDMKLRIDSYLKMSRFISRIGTKDRVYFFQKQREFLEYI